MKTLISRLSKLNARTKTGPSFQIQKLQS